MKKFLIIQTAFLGDVILTLPLVQALKQVLPDSQIDFIAIPQTADVLRNHPDISNLIMFDKHGKQSSLLSVLVFRNRLRAANYDVVLSPHRSLRSCLLARGTRAQIRIGFDNSALRSSFSEVVPWKFGVHEIERNLSLLQPLLAINSQRPVLSETFDVGGWRWGLAGKGGLPRLFISEEHRIKAERFLSDHGVKKPYAVVAPGTVWETKRYPIEMMTEVVSELSMSFENVVIIGGEKDLGLVDKFNGTGERVVVAIGSLPIMSSAEIIKHSSLLVANDSAPVHIASAFEVPTVAIFGPTVKDFGFYPYEVGDPVHGKKSALVEVEGLGCRPCAIHGGHRCPIVTFDCMRRISPGQIVVKALGIAENISHR
jgi:heptosyltransferase-2